LYRAEKICNIRKRKKAERERRFACYGMVGACRIKGEIKLYKKQDGVERKGQRRKG
jgi:hypothetical protein